MKGIISLWRRLHFATAAFVCPKSFLGGIDQCRTYDFAEQSLNSGMYAIGSAFRKQRKAATFRNNADRISQPPARAHLATCSLVRYGYALTVQPYKCGQTKKKCKEEK